MLGGGVGGFNPFSMLDTGQIGPCLNPPPPSSPLTQVEQGGFLSHGGKKPATHFLHQFV